MEWKTTWNDPLTNYVAPYHQLMGDKRTRTTIDETIRGIMGGRKPDLEMDAIERS